MQADWEISQSFTSDGQGIRCAAVLPATNESSAYRIITGSQGGSLVEFQVPSGEIRVLPFQHDHSITALLAGNDCYVTGCKDQHIRIFSSDDHSLLATLKGHEKPVTSLCWADNKERYLISGSWDGTAKVWNCTNRSLLATLPNHENSVCVTTLPTESPDTLHVATGSAGTANGNSITGHTVRLWSVETTTGTTQLLHSVANDHFGPIRDIVAACGSLVTCSNDGTVKLRDPSTGATQSTLAFPQHQDGPPILLSVASDDDSYMAASAEDGHVVVWDLSSMGEPQVLRHTRTVWKVLSLSGINGDLVTCCQDGMLRIFTRATERMAPANERELFAQEAEAAANQSNTGPSAEEIAQLPAWESQATMMGKSEGQVQLFRKNGIAIAAQWSATSRTWIEVGEVTGRSSNKNTIDGVEYDHVFPIEVDQTGGGVASLQIGYNDGENPFVAAQRFVDAHMLPQYHLQQISDYIQQRVGKQPAVLGTTASSSAPAPTMMTYEYLPTRTYKSFELAAKAAVATLEKMKKKIQEFHNTAYDDDNITSLMSTLAASNRYHSSKVTDAEMKAVIDLLNRSSPEQAFPALDLARLAVLHPDAASKSVWVPLTQRALALATSTTIDGPAIPMLSIRLFANAFKGGSMAKQAVTTYLDPILDCTAKYATSSNKNIRLSVATLLYNVSFFLHSSKVEATATRVVQLAETIVDAGTYESEALFRVLVALGTVVMEYPAAKTLATSMVSKVEPAATAHSTATKGVAKEVHQLLSSP